MKKILLFAIAIVVICWMNRNPGRKMYDGLNPAEKLEKRIESAEMKTYVDEKSNVKIPYPAFFNKEDTKDGSPLFTYCDGETKVISMSLYVEVNHEGWDIEEAVEHLTDSNTICLEMCENYFVLAGKMLGDNVFWLEKCYLINDQWMDYIVFFNPLYRRALKTLLEGVMDWNPDPLMQQEA